MGRLPREPATDRRGRCRDERSLRSRRRSRRPRWLPRRAPTPTSPSHLRRHNGGTDPTIASCASAALGTTQRRRTPAKRADGRGRPAGREQDDRGRERLLPQPTTTDAWAGLYYSSTAEAARSNSLCPATRPIPRWRAGQSPLFGFITAPVIRCRLGTTTAPVLRRDRLQPDAAEQRLDLGRAVHWIRAGHSARLRVHDDRLARNTVAIFVGHFEDKVQLEVDEGLKARTRATSTSAGRASRRGREQLHRGRHLDRRRPHVADQKVSECIHGNQGCDIAVTRTGLVFVDLAPVRIQAPTGAAAGRRDRLGQVDRRRPHVHQAGGRE